MSDPIAFPEQNAVLQAPPDSDSYCRQTALPIHRDVTQNPPRVISKWQLTAAEIEEVLRTGCIYLDIVGVTMPAAYVTSISPFEDQQ